MIEQRKKVTQNSSVDGEDDVELYDKSKANTRASAGFALFILCAIVLVVCFIFKIDIRDAISSHSAFNAGAPSLAQSINQQQQLQLQQQQQQQQQLLRRSSDPPPVKTIHRPPQPPSVGDKAVDVTGGIKTSSIEQELEKKAIDQIAKLRHMKFADHIVMEKNEEAKTEIAKLQDMLRTLLKMQYGEEPYTVEMKLEFPDGMMSTEADTKVDSILFALAPIALVPYSVYNFLQVIKNFKGGAFHRNAGHVLQAMVKTGSKVKSLAFQEYHPQFPHKKFTLGYAGRPGGPEFYISTLNNVGNHGPGSQGSRTEADSCFGQIIKGFDVVERMKKQPGAKSSGFVTDPANHIKIISLKLLPHTT